MRIVVLRRIKRKGPQPYELKSLFRVTPAGSNLVEVGVTKEEYKIYGKMWSTFSFRSRSFSNCAFGGSLTWSEKLS